MKLETKYMQSIENSLNRISAEHQSRLSPPAVYGDRLRIPRFHSSDRDADPP